MLYDIVISQNLTTKPSIKPLKHLICQLFISYLNFEHLFDDKSIIYTSFKVDHCKGCSYVYIN